LYKGTEVAEVRAAFIVFVVCSEEGGSSLQRNVVTFSADNATSHSESKDLHFHRTENLRSHEQTQMKCVMHICQYLTPGQGLRLS
jgi:hypothetical protein